MRSSSNAKPAQSCEAIFEQKAGKHGLSACIWLFRIFRRNGYNRGLGWLDPSYYKLFQGPLHSGMSYIWNDPVGGSSILYSCHIALTAPLGQLHFVNLFILPLLPDWSTYSIKTTPGPGQQGELPGLWKEAISGMWKYPLALLSHTSIFNVKYKYVSGLNLIHFVDIYDYL